MKVSIIFLELPPWIISPEAGPDQPLKPREIPAEAADFDWYLAGCAQYRRWRQVCYL